MNGGFGQFGAGSLTLQQGAELQAGDVLLSAPDPGGNRIATTPVDCLGGPLTLFGDTGTPPRVVAPTVTNRACLAPGGRQATGELEIEGSFHHDPEGELWIEMSGAGGGASDLLTVTGEVTLAGRLRVTSLAVSQPPVGAQLVVLRTQGGGVISGQFSDVVGGGSFDVLYEPDQVVLTVVEPPPALLFSDGFEGGELSAWSASLP